MHFKLFLLIFFSLNFLNSSELLTKDEQKYLLNNKTFTVCNQYNAYPLSALRNGKLIGISGEVFDYFEKELHIKFRAIDVTSVKDLNQKVAENKCDFVSIVGKNQKRFKNIYSSDPIYSEYFTIIGNLQSVYVDDRTDFSKHKFFVRHSVNEQEVKKVYPNLILERVPDLDKIMKDIKNNSNYHLISQRLMNETYIQRYGFNEYKINGIFENIQNELSVGINKNNPMMVSIINKTINSIGIEFFEKIKNKYILKEFKIEKSYNPFILLFACILIFLIIYIYFRKKQVEKTNKVILSQKQELDDISEKQKTLLKLFDKGDFVLFKWKNDKNWNIEYVSSNVEKLLGFTQEEIMSSKILYSTCIDKIDKAKIEIEIKDATESQLDYLKHKPYKITTKNGDIKWVSDSTVFIKNKKGEVTHYLGYIEDITEQINMQNRLKEAKVAADKANIAKSSFLANMSHEIRTPLNGMIGLTRLLLDTNLDEKQTEYLNKSLNSSKILLNLLNDVLDYSKIEAEKVELSNDEFVLDVMMQNLSDMFSYQAHEKGLDYIFTIDPNIPQLLIADQNKLMQILVNLVGNSIKFTQKGHVNINLVLKHKTVNRVSILFEVQDTGIGISKEKEKKLFKPFEQGDNVTTKEFGGTGLGLAISKKLVELMSGKIWIRSEAKKGSTFGFELNLEHKNDKTFTYNNNQILFQNQNFLFVDDNTIDRDYMTNIFQSWNIKLDTASNGQVAYSKIKEINYDYIIVDWKMPKINGIDLLKILQDEKIVIPHILMITAHNKEKLLSSAIKKHVIIDKVLEKPYTPSTLFKTLFEENYKFKQHIQPKQKEFKLSQTKKALLVEDNEINQLVALKIFEKIGFDVDIANNGEIALEKARDNKYDIIFMDIHMPIMNGLESTENIRKFDTITPIIALSAAVMQEDKDKSMHAQMNGHLNKPIEHYELNKILKKYFDVSIEETSIKKIPLHIDGINISKLQNELELDDDGVYVFYDKFKKYYKTELLDFIQNKNSIEYIKTFIHKLKGASGNLKIDSLYNLCLDIEKNNFDNKLLEILESQLQHILYEIDNKISPLIIKQENELITEDIFVFIDKIIEKLDNYELIEEDVIEQFIYSLKKNHISEEKIDDIFTLFSSNETERLVHILQDIKKVKNV